MGFCSVFYLVQAALIKKKVAILEGIQCSKFEIILLLIPVSTSNHDFNKGEPKQMLDMKKNINVGSTFLSKTVFLEKICNLYNG